MSCTAWKIAENIELNFHDFTRKYVLGMNRFKKYVCMEDGQTALQSSVLGLGLGPCLRLGLS